MSFFLVVIQIKMETGNSNQRQKLIANLGNYEVFSQKRKEKQTAQVGLVHLIKIYLIHVIDLFHLHNDEIFKVADGS